MTALVVTNARAIRERQQRQQVQKRRPGPRRRAEQHLFITRVEGAYWVRIQRTQLRVMQVFTDGKHGDFLGALAAALAYRNDLLRRLLTAAEYRRADASGFDEGLLRRLLTNRVPPGHGYVRRRIRRDGRDVFEGWVRLFDGACSRTTWFVDLHGVAGAKAGAEAWLARHQRDVRRALREAAA